MRPRIRGKRPGVGIMVDTADGQSRPRDAWHHGARIVLYSLLILLAFSLVASFVSP